MKMKMKIKTKMKSKTGLLRNGLVKIKIKMKSKTGLPARCTAGGLRSGQAGGLCNGLVEMKNSLHTNTPHLK